MNNTQTVSTRNPPARHYVSLREAPHKRSICETKMRYDVLLNGEYFDGLYFNMRGYVGLLPLPDGHKFNIGERGISVFRAEIRTINREAKQTLQGR